jgi:hypothetical protein
MAAMLYQIATRARKLHGFTFKNITLSSGEILFDGLRGAKTIP